MAEYFFNDFAVRLDPRMDIHMYLCDGSLTLEFENLNNLDRTISHNIYNQRID